MSLTTDEQSWLAEVEERVGKATEGPWLANDTGEDLPFTASARTDIPRLLSLVKRLVEENGRIRSRRCGVCGETMVTGRDVPILDQMDTLRSQVEVAKEALEFYANDCQDRLDEPRGVMGATARSALAALNQGSEVKK